MKISFPAIKSYLPALAIIFLFSACGGKKAQKQTAFPDVVNAEKTEAHIRFPNTVYWMLPPQGFSRSDKSYEWKYESAPGSMDYLEVSQSVKGTNFPTTVEEVRKKKEAEGHKVLEAKAVTYNGKPAIYIEWVSMNKFYHPELQVPMNDGTVFFISGAYTHETKQEDIDKIIAGMKQVVYDTDHQVDRVADRKLKLDDAASRFKFSGADAEGKTSYYTPAGRDCGVNCEPPYLLLFEAIKLISGDNSNEGQRLFPSYAEHLAEGGYDVKLVTGTWKAFTLLGKDAREGIFAGKDADGTPIKLLLTEVNNGFGVIILIGIAKEGDDASINDFRKLSSTLRIVQ